jgi:hypothetical protein
MVILADGHFRIDVVRLLDEKGEGEKMASVSVISRARYRALLAAERELKARKRGK